MKNYFYISDINVSDAVSTGNSMGFVDGNTNPALDDYEYDENGNMVKDRNKGIASISYNYLNLPEQIVFENSNSIEYTYNAAGVKLKKTVVEETANPEVRKEVDYLDGFQYAGEVLNFFPTAGGYVRATPVGNIAPGSPPTGYAYSYVYNYTDHLGNVRLSYSMDHLTGKLKILEENHYYPFGLRHSVYDTGGKKDFSRNPGDGIEPEPGLPPLLDYVTRMEYQYKYNGKEFQDELNLNLYDYHARNYDPAIGRWINIDPMAPKYFSHSTYAYALNNPVYFIDPDGMQVTSGGDEEKPCKEAGDCELIELETAVITAKNPKKKKEDSSEESIFSFPSMTSIIFGRDGEKSIHGAYSYVNKPENIGDFKKMIDAKREGELGVAIFFSSVVALPYAVFGGSMILGSMEATAFIQSGQVAMGNVVKAQYTQEVVLKFGLDLGAKALFNQGQLNASDVTSSLGGALVPTNAWFASGLVSETVGLGTQSIVSDKPITQEQVVGAGIKSFIVAPLGGAGSHVFENITSRAILGSSINNGAGALIEKRPGF